MGTVVLSPQDCIPSSHRRRNQQAQAMSQYGKFRVADSKASHSLIMDRRSPDPTSAKGILPSPVGPRQVRPNLRNSNIQAMSSLSRNQSCSPLTQSKNTMFLSNAYDASHPEKLFTSSQNVSNSLGLCTASQTEIGVPCTRSPFKVVQDNQFEGILTSQNNYLQKPKLSNSGLIHQRRKICNENLDRMNSKSARRFQGISYDSSNAVHKSKPLTTKSSRIPFLERDDETKNKLPEVKILQRPNDDEAAAELMARFFCHTEVNNTTGLSSSTSSFESFADNGKLPLSASSTSSFPDTGKLPGNIKSAPLVEEPNQGRLSPTRDNLMEEHSDMNTNTLDSYVDNSSPWSNPSTWERWAGPSYINSPPPSALPIPKFSKTNDVPSDCKLFASESSKQSVKAISSLTQSGTVKEAVEIATKNLKRMLNLDICR